MKHIHIKCKGNRYLSYSQLKTFQGNLKEMSKINVEKLKQSILIHGWIAPIFVWNNDYILDGHGRLLVLSLLLQEGYTIGDLPIVDVEAQTKKEAAQILLAINSKYQTITDDGLYEFMNEMEINFKELEMFELPDIDMERFGAEFFEKKGLTEDDNIPDVPEKPKTKLGDLYFLGSHRLLCGDATKKEDVERLMDGKKADMVFTDPPYGINIVSTNKTIGFGGRLGFVGAGGIVPANMYSPIIGDNTTITAKSIYDYAITNNIKKIILWGGNYYTDFCPPTSCWLIWDKRGDIPSNNFADCEIAWTNMTSPSRIYKQIWSGLLREGDRKTEGLKRCHPTQKPVGLAVWCFENYSERENIISDPFLGSGSTLIACEKTNRICYGMEIDPHYCDVIVQRYIDFTGNNKIIKNGLEYEEKQR